MGGVLGLSLCWTSCLFQLKVSVPLETFSFIKRPDCIALSLIPLMPLSFVILVSIACLSRGMPFKLERD